jgi:5-methylcytosine-specific restriction enzyme subunit McrC
MKSQCTITVFEHEILKADGVKLSTEQLRALQGFYGEKGTPYFTLIHNGVRFNEFVGVIQVGNTTIEVLPKADKTSTKEEWKRMLIGMLRAVNQFEVHTPSSSSLKLKSNSILDLYFELFLNEVQGLLHGGLAKKYRKTEDNCNTLKGSIQFAKHIQKNIIHKEKFFVRYTTYDVNHILHKILWKTINLIAQINTNASLNSKATTLQMWFPEMDDMKVTEATFNRIVLNRKTESYRKALEIARLLLLNFHPDVSHGRNHVLALMFDMNVLWEKFIYVSLSKELHKKTLPFTIKAQARKYFWKPEQGNRVGIRPDIVLQLNESNFVIDTKWKNLTNLRPSDDDLKQMFVYHDYFTSQKVALAYPGNFKSVRGWYFNPKGEHGNRECSLIGIAVQKDVKLWQVEIANTVWSWINQ